MITGTSGRTALPKGEICYLARPHMRRQRHICIGIPDSGIPMSDVLPLSRWRKLAPLFAAGLKRTATA
jgi:hypothetical protein